METIILEKNLSADALDKVVNIKEKFDSFIDDGKMSLKEAKAIQDDITFSIHHLKGDEYKLVKQSLKDIKEVLNEKIIKAKKSNKKIDQY